MIIQKLSDICSPPIFYSLEDFIPDSKVYIKLEGLNIAGSIKLKSAKRMLEAIETQSNFTPGETTIVTSSSGNLGIALSLLCKERNYPFICVSDANLSPTNEFLIKAYGGKVIKITHQDENCGYLANRIRYINKLIDENPTYIFLDQYENVENTNAHYLTTAYEIAKQFTELDYLFIGAGTTGTLGGCAQFFKEFYPNTKIIAVDAEGSVTFGNSSGKRYVPGLGTSLKPKLADSAQFDDLLNIKETDTIFRCRHLLERYGLLLGGSSGTVLQAVFEYSNKINKNSTVVAISPDFGERYIHTIYDDIWVKDKYPSFQ